MARMPGVHVEYLRGGTQASIEGRRVRAAMADGSAQVQKIGSFYIHSSTLSHSVYLSQVTVGTHALLGSSVNFKKLELLVVDEEQRFGVAQKEKLKAMSTGADVLTLTATPIPRTMQMSLSGLRDLSTLKTPPPGRKEIGTIVAKYDKDTVRAAISKEMLRGGQTFFVVPRIANIETTAANIAELVPNARILVAHGRLKDVENVIIRFSEGQADVLVATSVIESGLDLPMANTIIVTDPQQFGLAALYQLRGRVGRSPREAFAYFFYPPNQPMTLDALRRLQALKELSKLGGGFELANRDLEIRGSGSMVGSKQSGVAEKVGAEVYLALLQEALEEAKGTDVTPVLSCEVHLPAAKKIMACGLPEGFLGEAARRESSTVVMSVMKPRDITKLARKWREQHAGALPGATEAVLKVYLLEAFGRRLGVDEMRLEGTDVVLLVPGWSDSVWERLRPELVGLLAEGGAVFDPEAKELLLRQLGAQSPAKQLAVLLGVLGKLYVYLEGKENFGFS